MFFLSETHLGKVKVDELKRKLQCDHYIIVESDGRMGFVIAKEEGSLNYNAGDFKILY